MRESLSKDEYDNAIYPDPLTIDYDNIIKSTKKIPEAVELKKPDLEKLWVFYYKNTDKLEYDDILWQVNDIPHVGMLEPGDIIYLFNTDYIKSYDFKDLEQTPQS